MNADSVMQGGKSATGKLVDITRAEFKANPFPYYAQLREHTIGASTLIEGI